MNTATITLSLDDKAARVHEWTDDTISILNAAMVREGLCEDDVAAAWRVSSEFVGAEGADLDLTTADRDRILALCALYVA